MQKGCGSRDLRLRTDGGRLGMCLVKMEWEGEEGRELIFKEYLPPIRSCTTHSPFSSLYQFSFYFYPRMTLQVKV